MISIEDNPIRTWTRLGLWTSNLAVVLNDVVASGPANRTEFCTVKLSESMVCEISSTLTNGEILRESNGNRPTNDV